MRFDAQKQTHIIRPHPEHAGALYAQRVLVHFDDLFVQQNRFELRTDGGQLVGHEQRSGQYGPDGHLRFALVQRQSVIADYQLKNRQRSSLNTAYTDR